MWEAMSSCLQVSGQYDLSEIGIGCQSAAVTGSRQVTGTWIATVDGKYADKTTTTGSETWKLERSCLLLSGTRVACEGLGMLLAGVFEPYGYTSFTCADATTGGGCTCKGTIEQAGGIGLLYYDLNSNGNYATGGNTLTLDETLRYPYCASASRLTLAPQSTSPTLTGTVVLQKAAGTGGTGGTSAPSIP
jgi:hypothetical protein